MEETNHSVETFPETSLQSSDNASQQPTKKVRKKRSLWKSWKRLKGRTKFYLVVLHLFALVGAGILGAWAFFELGFTNNKGGADKNNRYLTESQHYLASSDSVNSQEAALNGYRDLSVLRQFYPKNADLIFNAAQYSDRPTAVQEMIYAANMYMQDDDHAVAYRKMVDDVDNILKSKKMQPFEGNVIPWMNDSAWPALKAAILKDSALIYEAARLTGVEPRLIVGCLVGEQVRLFNSKREMYKRYLGPMKVLSVQSQFSLGVNGIKDFTAMQVERNLTDTASIFYMGKPYEHILDFQTENHQAERISRLTNYRNHLYSYIYTGCILHQTMLQWRRSGYDIVNRPDILFTLFNLGFAASKPGPDPQCGGSHITVHDAIYTFGVICNDFYFSGELAEQFPLKAKRFVDE
ncbi:MAG: hypothetical protein IKZ54_10925 [Bacteroidales bacterium]|nr:hypothetical protein [Bacteroidales bacterium]